MKENSFSEEIHIEVLKGYGIKGIKGYNVHDSLSNGSGKFFHIHTHTYK